MNEWRVRGGEGTEKTRKRGKEERRKGGKEVEEKANISSPENHTQAVQLQSTEQQEKTLRQYSTHSIHLGRSKMV